MDRPPEEAQWLREFADLMSWMNTTVGASLSLFVGIMDGDDWTLIVRLHAIIEAGLNHMIINELKNPNLSKIVSQLETSNPRTGKLAFAKAMNLIEDQTFHFVKSLSEFRNLCVHDIRNFTFNLESHLKSFNEKQKSNLFKALLYRKNPDVVFKPGTMSSEQLVKADTRLGLYGATMNFMNEVRLHEIRTRAPHQSTPTEQ